ncbi:MAG: hypothetical protein RLZZ324_69 [Candidatus Parcubacteria bacterium]|jgi:hypothetical protein
MADKPTGLTKPAGSVPQGAGPVIHVIPEQFYGAAIRQKVVEPPSAAAPSATGSVTPPGMPPKPPAPAAKKSRLPLFALLAVVVLLLGGGVAYFLLAPKTPQVAVNAPKAPFCGDGSCDAATESVANCSADCKAPAPVCGDSKCDASESTTSCPADCGAPPAPAAVCGDGTCTAPGETAQTCEADCKAAPPKPGSDLDSDGLSDQEEKEVFGTDINSPNTDKDAFVDLNEALNLFDPAKPSPAMLRDNPHIATYTDTASGYSLLRPSAWTAKDATAEDKTATFTAPSGEFISVLVSDKPAAQELMDWYLAQAPGVTSSQVEPYVTRGGYQAILSPDRMTAFVDLGNRVAVVSYNLGKATEVQYRVTFQMMVQSIVKK